MAAGAGCGCGVASLVEDVSRLAMGGGGTASSPPDRRRTLLEGLDQIRARLHADPPLREAVATELSKRAATPKVAVAPERGCGCASPAAPVRPRADRATASRGRARLRRLRIIHQSPDAYATALRSLGRPTTRAAGVVPSAAGGVPLYEDAGPPGSVRAEALSELARASLATLILRPRTAAIYTDDVTHPDVPDPYDPDLEPPDKPGVARPPLGSTCYRYRAVIQETPGYTGFASRTPPGWTPAVPVPKSKWAGFEKTVRPLTPVDRRDPCDPVYDDVQLVDFDTCLPASFTYGEAVRILESHGLDPQREVWRALTDWFDGADIDPDALGLIPEDASWYEPFSGEPLWNQWDPATSGYTPVTTATPWKAALFGALRLICGLEAGIPAEVEGARLRDEVSGRIRDGDMEYRLYGQSSPGADGNDLLALAWDVLGLLWVLLTDRGWEVEILIQVLDGLDGENDLDPALLEALYAFEELVMELVMQPFQCPGTTPAQVSCLPGTPGTNAACGIPGEVAVSTRPCTPPCPGGTVDMRNGVQFQFTGATDGAQNHGLFSRRVWLCMATVDHVAVAADWLQDLATRHLARSLVPTLSAEEQQGHYLAYTIVIRMYASALAALARPLVHETAHNINLYHCYDPWTSRPMACQQDHARAAWQAYAHARLGMGLTLRSGTTLQVQWDAAVLLDRVQGFPTARGADPNGLGVWRWHAPDQRPGVRAARPRRGLVHCGYQRRPRGRGARVSAGGPGGARELGPPRDRPGPPPRPRRRSQRFHRLGGVLDRSDPPIRWQGAELLHPQPRGELPLGGQQRVRPVLAHRSTRRRTGLL